MKVTAERRRVLRMLAGGPRGDTEAVLMAHGFTPELLGGLIVAGLAISTIEKVKAGGRMIEVTDSGQRRRGPCVRRSPCSALRLISITPAAGVPPQAMRALEIRGLIEHVHAARYALTDEGRAVLLAMLHEP
jgi:hypothetical protein